MSKKIVDIEKLTRYHNNINSLLIKKQDVLNDIEDIRTGASKGATALQSIPSEYITEMELINKNYATRVEIPSIDGLATEAYVNQREA